MYAASATRRVHGLRVTGEDSILERQSELPLETIVGRDREVEEVLELVRATRFVTITGLGGTGKSRLAREVARRWQAGEGRAGGGPAGEGPAGERPAGSGTASVVDLSAIDNADFVAPAIAQLLDLADRPGQDPDTRVSRGLASWTGLLVLDDVEEIRAIGPRVHDWVAASPGVSILLTSRVELGVAGEQVYPLAPLALPASARPEDVETSPAGALFLREARRHGALRILTEPDCRAIAEICVRVGGMPLGVQLAAARTQVLRPATIARRLGHPDTDDGAGGLDVVLRWTLDLLEPVDRSRLLGLAVVPGEFDLELAGVLWGTDPVESLARLVRLSLVRTVPGSDERWELLVPVRAFLLHELRQTGGEPRAMDALVSFVASLVPGLWTTSPLRFGPWVARMREHHDTLRAALDWWAATDVGTAAEMMDRLTRYWVWTGWSWEGRARALALIDVPGLPDNARIHTLLVLAVLDSYLSSLPMALERAQEAERLARAGGDRELLLITVITLATSHGVLDEFEAEWPLLQEGLALARELGHPIAEINVLNNIALHLMELDRLEEAEGWAAQALEAGRRLGDEASEIQALYDLSEIASLRGRHAEAMRHAEAGWMISQQIGPGLVGARIAASRLEVAVAAGAVPEALVALDDAVPLALLARGWAETAKVVDACGWLLADLGRPTEAVRLIGMASAVRRAANAEGDRDPRLTERLPRLRQLLGNATYDRLIAEGERSDYATTLDSLPVIVRAGARAGTVRIRGPYGTLSTREREVLAMVARGATDPEIGAALDIATKTASVHVANLKRKVGVETRIDLALQGQRLLREAGAG
ncbi:MAG: LuxR C-terminal-related transcriptional regulator [Candidatus Limnocylindrales bacterium]